jgi:hypothetical protein
MLPACLRIYNRVSYKAASAGERWCNVSKKLEGGAANAYTHIQSIKRRIDAGGGFINAEIDS